LGSSDTEFQRLYLQSLTFENETTHTLRLAGIGAGMKCLDMGCGFGDTTFLMSKLVGHDGKVLGMDVNPECIEMAKRKLKASGINNIEFAVGNAYDTGLKESSFDLIFSRFLFQHLKDCNAVIEEMSRIVLESGTICTEELDHGLWISYPEEPAIDSLRKCYIRLLEIYGSDPYIARKLYKIFLETNLKPNVSAYSICVPMIKEPHNALGVKIAEVLKDKIVKNDLMSIQDFDVMLKGLVDYSRTPDGMVMYAITFRVWGKKILDKS
jgi:ubiquinone/menaquinone biosynthesis C-methylase UbiE